MMCSLETLSVEASLGVEGCCLGFGLGLGLDDHCLVSRLVLVSRVVVLALVSVSVLMITVLSRG